MDTEKIGFIGLGVLGSAIAANLVNGGASVVGYDISEAACSTARRDGVVIAGSIAELARQCPILFTCLPNAAALRTVISATDGICSVAHAGQIVVELSTLALADKQAMRAICEAHDRRAVDCPVSGNRIMALANRLTAFCSGAPADCEAVDPILKLFCAKTHYVGAFGCGSTIKYCGNILNLVHNSVAAEAMVLAIKSGVDPKVFHEVISGSGSSSAMFEVRGGLMVNEDYGQEGMNFSIPLKDAAIISNHAASVRCPITLYQTALQFYHAAAAQGLGHLDAAAVCTIMEKMAGVERQAPNQNQEQIHDDQTGSPRQA